MSCPMCNAVLVAEMDGDQMTIDDKYHLYWGKVHPAAGLVAVGLQLAGAVAKKVCSTVYECRSCHHRWRKWFA